MANPKDVDILILGNGGVALSALRTIRARNKDLRVLLVSKEKESFYVRPFSHTIFQANLEGKAISTGWRFL